GLPLRTLAGHTRGINSVAYAPDGKLLASGDEDGRVKLWEPSTGQELASLCGPRGGVNAVAFSPDGVILASAGGELNRPGAVTLWSVASGQELVTLKGHHNEVMAMAFAPDGMTIATGSLDGTVRLWDVSMARSWA